jgi:hypothetical protein
MGWETHIRTSIILGLTLLMTIGAAFADQPLRLVIEEGLSDSKIPISAVCPNLTKAEIIERTGATLRFADTKNPDKQVLKTQNLPKFYANKPYLEGVFQLSSISSPHSNPCMFITSTVPKGTIEYVLPQLEEHGKEALSTGNGWMVMKSPPPDYTNSLGIEQNMSMAVATGTSPDAGLLSILSEDTNTITYPKSVSGCFRPYIPTKSSRYGSGIVQWSRDNPSRNGY